MRSILTTAIVVFVIGATDFAHAQDQDLTKIIIGENVEAPPPPTGWSPYNPVIQQRGYSYASNEVDIAEQRDKEAFTKLVNMLLWDDDGDQEQERQGRQFFYRRHGLLRRPMPVSFRRKDNFAGSMYNSIIDGCYGIACQLGLSGLASSISRLMT